jgi:hypothetical protein
MNMKTDTAAAAQPHAQPYVSKPGPHLFVDVDETLVFPHTRIPNWLGERPALIPIGGRMWAVHQHHVELILDCHARGHTIVIWSAGGSEWAEMVTRALNLESKVHVICAKPSWWVDDHADANRAIGGGRVYLTGPMEHTVSNSDTGD